MSAMTGTACCAKRRRKRTAAQQRRVRQGMSEAQDRRVSEPVKPCELRVSIAIRRRRPLLQLVSSDMYLRVCLDDCLPPRCMWFFSVGPEEIVLLVRGLLLYWRSCLGTSSSALWLRDGRGRYRRRHGGQCQWM